MSECNDLGGVPPAPEGSGHPFRKLGGPFICTQPSFEGEICPCSWFALNVVAGDSSGQLEYQWYIGQVGDTDVPVEDGVNFIGAEASQLRLRLCEDTEFWVRVTNVYGSCRDSEGVQVILSDTAVAITQQPVFTSEGGVVCTNSFGTIEMLAETCIGTGGFSDTKNNESVKVSTVQPFYDGMIDALGYDIEVAYNDEFLVIDNLDRETLNATALQALIETLPSIGLNVLARYESGESPNDPIYPWADFPAPDNFIIEFINDLECQPLPYNLSVRAITEGSHTGTAGSGVDAYCNPQSNPFLVEITKGQRQVIADSDPLNDPDMVCYEWYEGLTGDTSMPVMNQNPDPAQQNILFVQPPADTSYWARVRSHACMEAGCSDYYEDSDTVFVTTVESLTLVDPIEPEVIQPDVTNIFAVGVTGETPAYQWYGGKLLNPDVVVEFGAGEFDIPTIGNTYRVSTNGAGQDYTPWGGPDLTDMITYPNGGVGETFVATTDDPLVSGMELGDITKPLYNIGHPSAVLNNTVLSGAQGPEITLTSQQTNATGLASLIEVSPPTLKVGGESVPDEVKVEVLIDGDYTSIGGTANQFVGDQFITPASGQLEAGTSVNIINVSISSTYIWMLAENQCNSIEQGIYDIVSMPFETQELTNEFSFIQDENTSVPNITTEIGLGPPVGVTGVKEVTAEYAFTSDDELVKELTMEIAFVEPPPP
jgi:hypothetical protein